MALLPFDELNTPKVDVEPPEKYFSKMAISKEQKEERVETANDLMDVLLFFFALLAIEMGEDQPDYDMVYRKFNIRFRDVVAKHSRMDDYQKNYVDEYTQMQYEITRRHMEAVGVGRDGRTDGGWWTSPDRAMAIGENAANIILNHEELLEAFEDGAVSKKWVTKGDNKVRESHNEVTKEKIPLEEYFVVGHGIMLHPLDWDNNPKQCYGCRCAAVYYDKNGKIVKVGGNKNKVNKTDEKVQFTEAQKYSKIDTEIPMNLQYFAEKALERQSVASLRKGIRSLEEAIEFHKENIANPKRKWKDWDTFTEARKAREIHHWEKEIENFKESIENRKNELLRRGEKI